MPVNKYEGQSFVHCAADLGNDVYLAAVQCFETLEARKMVHGNGHHMAQEVARFARELLEKHKRNVT